MDIVAPVLHRRQIMLTKLQRPDFKLGGCFRSHNRRHICSIQFGMVQLALPCIPHQHPANNV